jgi:hypothetical protein
MLAMAGWPWPGGAGLELDRAARRPRRRGDGYHALYVAKARPNADVERAGGPNDVRLQASGRL